MNNENYSQKSRDYMEYQQSPERPDTDSLSESTSGPAITISREAGTGEHLVAEHLSARLRTLAPGKDRPWTVFDQNLIEHILEDHHLPKRLASFMPEDRVSAISDMVQELCGVHPSRWTLMHHAAETILRLAHLGHAILVGRGAGVITSGMSHVFHVRLIGSLEKRAGFLARAELLSVDAARDKARALDNARRRYLKRYFHRDNADNLMHHLILNTDHLTPEDSAEIIAVAALRYLKQDRRRVAAQESPVVNPLNLKEWTAQRRLTTSARTADQAVR